MNSNVKASAIHTKKNKIIIIIKFKKKKSLGQTQDRDTTYDYFFSSKECSYNLVLVTKTRSEKSHLQLVAGRVCWIFL